MTLSSSTSRQQRKSMLPKPRPSVRISSGRRVSSNDHTTTSRIARRVPSPSPLLAVAATSSSSSSSSSSSNNNNNNNNNGLVMQAQAQARAAVDSYNLTPPEFGPRRAESPSRIPPWSAGLSTSSSSRPTPAEQSGASSSPSLMSTGSTPSPSPERKKGPRVDVNVQYPAAAAAPPARHLSKSRRPASLAASTTTALTLANNFLRVDNDPKFRDGDGIIPTLTWKKIPFTNSVRVGGGKENQRPPRTHARVPPPPVALTTPTPTIPLAPRSIRRSVVTQSTRPSSFREISFRKTSRPLVIRKQPLTAAAAAGTSQVRSASGASGVLPVVLGSVRVPAGIQALIADIDRFAKEWMEMFDELSAVAVARDHPEDRGLSKLDAYIRSLPTGQTKDAGPLQADNPVAGKGTPKRLLPVSSGSAALVNTLQASTNGETVHFDVTSASLARWQHRDKAMVKDAPLEEDKPERDQPEAASASATDPPTDGPHYLQRAVLRNASYPVTPQASRHLPSLTEIDQSLIISGSHLAEMTSVVLSNSKDDLLESFSTAPRGINTTRHNATARQARYYPPSTVPKLSSSPPSNFASLSPVSASYSPSPWINLRAHEFTAAYPASDAVPARASSLRGLRAIFKRTSAGLTGAGGHRQRAESLKERISEPRVLSLGSVSISSLRDAGFAGGCAQPRVPEVSTMITTGDLARITTAVR